MLQRHYKPGDWVVFRKVKRSTSPGPRAQHIAPARYGEEYVYEVEKYWVVEEVGREQVVLRTRRGKRHVIQPKDQRLRRANLWERLVLRDRFPRLEDDRMNPHQPSESAATKFAN